MPTHERPFLDANVLVYAIYADASQHEASHFLIEQILTGDRRAFLSPQVLSEVYAVITDKRKVTKPQSPEEASSIMETLVNCPSITILPLSQDVSRRLAKLVRIHDIRSADVFDAQIVATMMEHGLQTICTYNVKDFTKYPSIRVMSPGE